MGCQRPVTQAASRDAARSQDLRWIVIRKGSSCRQRATSRRAVPGVPLELYCGECHSPLACPCGGEATGTHEGV
jgi:hypothetical protein